MPPRPKSDLGAAGQQTIAFARRSRRSDAAGKSATPGTVHKGKPNAKTTSSALSPRVHHPVEQRNVKSDGPKSSEAINEILNGNESKTLLNQLRQDRLECPRFHQDDLPVAEQLLHQFDMIQEYGPCQGLTRMQRWNRAERLGKKPPRHIKAVLEAAESRPEYGDRYRMSVFGELGQF